MLTTSCRHQRVVVIYFVMKDMGEVNYVIKVKILRDRSGRLLGLSQKTYIK